MPEGDTIYRTAINLRRAIEGAEIIAGPERLRGQTVAGIESRGKHLLIWFRPSGLALHTHMMMQGSWHLYRPGESWRRSRAAARVVLETPEWVAVCFSAPVVALLTSAEVARHPVLRNLGPDALDDDTDLEEAARRLDALAHREIGVALADQRVLAGVGNVYRCEVLFLGGVNPWDQVAALEVKRRHDLLAAAERLLKANATETRRRTTSSSSQRLYVYGRAGRPCLRCGEVVAVGRQGPQARITYWCPRCQPGISQD